MKNYIITLLLPFLFFQLSFAQRGKDGIVSISTNSTINEYTFLTSDINSGGTSLQVNDHTLNSLGNFSGILSPGDLILIIQIQGVDIDLTSGNSNWGQILSYENCGNYEYAEVANCSNNIINLRCGTKNSYTASGKTQIIRVPRYEQLTINAQVSAPDWNGQIGGIVVLECLNDILINAGGSIDVSSIGFRGGTAQIVNSNWGSFAYATNNPLDGSEKGESIFGSVTDLSLYSAERGKGAPANGGGGANSHNCGGGGGANGGIVASYVGGIGVPDNSYGAIWNLESPGIQGQSSSGGGRGGYSFSASNQNETSVPPGDGSWGGDQRKNNGGLGGRPLDYSQGKIFMGGAGGAGDLNESASTGGDGGNGGGIVLIKCYGNLTGSGSINANGENGEDITSTSPPFNNYAGRDGAGGAGAGGTIVLDVHQTLSGVSCNANGGSGGNQVLVGGTFYFSDLREAEGPGGGGSGGVIIKSNGSIVSSVLGGINGVTNSESMTAFPPNGATSGAEGSILNSLSAGQYDLTAVDETICAGNSITLYATPNGTLPSGTNIIWYDAETNGNFIGFGNTFSTGNLFTDTTFYVGFCPGTYTIPVNVTMGSSFTYDDSNVLVSEENCGQSDGAITGITITGGAQPLQYEWNTVLANNQDLNNVDAGNYTLVVTDNNGCAATIGTYSIGENTGPSIDDSGIIVEDDHCGQGAGSISNIVISGNSPFSYNWNNVAASSQDTSNLNAGSFSLEVTDTYGCSTNSGPYVVANIDGPLIDTNGILITAESCGLQNGTISNISVTGGVGPLNYSWNNSSQNTLDISNLSSGTYQVTVTDIYGCSDISENIIVPTIGFPTAWFTFTPAEIYTNDQINISDSSYSDIIDWMFTLPDGSQESDQNFSISFEEQGAYEICLRVENNAGCPDSVCRTITVNEQVTDIIVPNIFTPNSDGTNEYFTVSGISANYGLTIINRWGKEIFTESPYLNLWNGRNQNGKLIPEGTYYYILTPLAVNNSQSDLEPITGSVMIIR